MTEKLFTGRRIDTGTYDGIAVTRIVCPDHPTAKFWKWIDLGKKCGEVYGERDQFGHRDRFVVHFNHIEVYVDYDAVEEFRVPTDEEKALSRAMKL